MLVAMALAGAVVAGERPLVIGHRGACAYLPEHTLESAAYAHALGVDYIEQDVVSSRDNVLVVLHDIHLEATTDVASRFPGRARADGRFYALDFTWSELRSLQVRERFDPVTGRPVYPRRFSAEGASFRLCTLEEQLRLIEGLDRSTGRRTGIYVEFKEPAFHAAAGRDLGAMLLATLAEHGAATADAKVIIQCFDAAALQRLRTELRTPLPLVVLLESGEPATPARLRELASFAQGIGPPLSMVLTADGTATALVTDAHAAGLVVHPYTVRADALPAGMPDVRALLRALLRARVDGFFIDCPDIGREMVAELPD
jgi:glycerophosphoryl diester phosphodiesterase